jgi:hypothetical protein
MKGSATELVRASVQPSGEHLRLELCDGQGAVSELVLSVGCARQLLLALPRLTEAALQRRHDDASLRLVNRLAGFRLERGGRDARGIRQYILSLDTDEGLCVSLASPATQLGELAVALLQSVVPDESARSQTPLQS